jgi:hypothetical protein
VVDLVDPKPETSAQVGLLLLYGVHSLGTGKGAGKVRLQIRDSANTGSSKTIIPRDF